MILRPILADGIDLPLVMFYGLVVLVPLLLFEVAVEGGILARGWRIPFRELARPVFLANCWSLVAGIPTKILNAVIYSYLLPDDLASYVTRYPFAVALGTLVYFLVTVLVEAFYLSRWLKRKSHELTRTKFWLGVLIANIATYAVLGPIHYVATRPINNVKEFTTDTRWARQPPVQIIYIDPETRFLKSIYSDGSKSTTLVPIAMKDYLVTSNLEMVLFDDEGGMRHLYRTDIGRVEQNDAVDLVFLAKAATFGTQAKEKWGGEDSFKDRRAWAEPGLGNRIRVYQTNDYQNSLVEVAINPGLLHISDLRFALSHPVFVSDGRECLFQSRTAIYLLDIEHRRVGKVVNGRNFILLTPLYARSP